MQPLKKKSSNNTTLLKLEWVPDQIFWSPNTDTNHSVVLPSPESQSDALLKHCQAYKNDAFGKMKFLKVG